MNDKKARHRATLASNCAILFVSAFNGPQSDHQWSYYKDLSGKLVLSLMVVIEGQTTKYNFSIGMNIIS